MYKIIILIVFQYFVLGCSWMGYHYDAKPFSYVDENNVIYINHGSNANNCSVCDMSLSENFKTNYIAKYDNITNQYCSLHCFAQDLKKVKKIKNPMVVDVNSLKFINIADAYYVVNSDIDGVKSNISKLAFSSLEAAKKFQDEHGGEVVNFYKALDISRKDFIKKSWYNIF